MVTHAAPDFDRRRARPTVERARRESTGEQETERGGSTVKFMCLVYNDDELLEAMPEAEFWAFSDAHVAVDEELKRDGRSLVAEALQPARTAQTVRVRAGRRHVTDGPYAEAKEQVGGIYLIEARDMEEAVAIAARIPSASVTGIEVRPVWELRRHAPRSGRP
jgi:hypothetical protein